MIAGLKGPRAVEAERLIITIRYYSKTDKTLHDFLSGVGSVAGSGLPADRAEDRFRGPVDVLFGRRPVGDGDSHRAHPVPRGTAEPADALFLNRTERAIRRDIRIAARRRDAHEHLIQRDLVQNLHAIVGAQAIREPPREAAAAVDEVGDAAASERLKRRIHGKASGPARR